VTSFDLPGALRRIRRIADLSQRDLATKARLSASAIGHAETGRRDLPVRVLSAVAALAGLRLALLDADGTEVPGMGEDGVTDGAGRRFPAHLDTRYGDQDWWHGGNRYEREQPWYTFDRVRETRDFWRGRLGTPGDHLRPQPGDSPHERAAARAAAARERRQEELRRLRDAGLRPPPAPPFTCTCPASCDELDDWSGRPVHAENCPCRCDLG
jgi:transcriptional regulator with XRE-family HTH domain